jgi:hypothetical protein
MIPISKKHLLIIICIILAGTFAALIGMTVFEYLVKEHHCYVIAKDGDSIEFVIMDDSSNISPADIAKKSKHSMTWNACIASPNVEQTISLFKVHGSWYATKDGAKGSQRWEIPVMLTMKTILIALLLYAAWLLNCGLMTEVNQSVSADGGQN